MMFEKATFEKLASKVNSQHLDLNNSNQELDLIPISSMEEVAMRFRNSDENNHYEYFLLEAKTPLTKNNVSKAVPPPFTPKVAVGAQAPKVETAIASTDAPVAAVSAVENAVNFDSTSSTEKPAGARAAKTEKDDIPYLADNADLLLAVGELELARNIYRAILKTGEASDVAYAGLAACADKEGLIDQAIQFAWDSVAFAPNKKGYQILAQLLVQQGRDQEASQALTRALKSLSLTVQEKGEYYKMIGNCMSRLGQSNDAERAYKKALELSPASDEVQSNLGSLYLEQGQVSDAKRCYQDAIASNAGNDKAWVGLGLCCVAEGDKESAHEAFARSLEKNLRNSTAVFHLVKCAYEIKKYTTAEKMLANYVEIAPVSASLLYSLAGLQFHVGKRREATQTAKRILQLKADHQGARDLLKRIDHETTSA